MVRDRRLPYRKASTQSLAANFDLRRDVLEDLEPSWIGQCLRDSLKLLGIHGG